MVPRALWLTAEDFAACPASHPGLKNRVCKMNTSSGPSVQKSDKLGNPSSSSHLRMEGEAAGDAFSLFSKGFTEEYTSLAVVERNESF